MKKPSIQRSKTKSEMNTARLPSISAEAALSFLKDTKGAVTWSVSDLAATLKSSRTDAEQAVALLAAQGYAQAAPEGEWMTTPAGESVAGAKLPRFSRESVEQAVESLKGRINRANKDSKVTFRITDAIAFGDFLLKERTRVQGADVGIGLVQRGEASGERRSAFSAKAESQFLRQLRGRAGFLHIRPYANWMRRRSHRDLLEIT